MNEIRELNVADDIYIGTTDYDIEDLYEKLTAELDKTDNYTFTENLFI